MGEWKTEILDKLCVHIQSGGTPKSDNEEYYIGEIPFVTIEDITSSNKYLLKTKKHISEEGLKNSAAWLVPKHSLMYSIYATLGSTLISKIEAATNQAILNLIVNTKKIDVEYLYYFLTFFKNQIYKYSAQTTQSNLNAAIVKAFEINFPEDKPEQTRIAEILSTADEAIAHTEALIAKYQRIKTGLMQDLLTKGIDENGNIRSKATHKFVVKNGIEVPEEWEVDTLGTLIKAVDAHPSHRTPPSIENGAPYLGISDIDDEGNVDLKKCRKVSYSVLAEHNNRYQLRDGDIIFGKIGTIGEPKRLKAWSSVTISANVILIQPYDTSDFIFWVLNSEYINNQVKNTIHSTSQPAFGMEKVRALTILIPPQKERETIQVILNQNESNILSTKRHLSKLRSLKTGLMQDLLSGKVRVDSEELIVNSEELKVKIICK